MVVRTTSRPPDFLLQEFYANQQTFSMEHRAAPDYAVWPYAAERCLEPDRRVNRIYTAIVTDLAYRELTS